MSIKADVVNALRWTAAGRLAGQLGSWAITIYVIRILNPADYGLMSMATVLMGFAMLLNELGVIPALIQSRRVDDYLIRQLFGFVLTSNVLVFWLLFLVAPALSTFFGEPRLTAVVRVLAVTILIGGVSAVPTALLERDLQFRGISLVEFSSMVLGSATTLVLAIQGFGVWSLVFSNIVATTAKTIGIFVVSGFRLLPVFRLAGLRPIFVFGANITGQRILWYINSSADVVLVGKLMGDQALGIYSVAFQLATLPVSKIFGIINRVAFPAYARLQHDRRQATDYFVTSVRLSWFVLCPILWGMSSVSHEFVEVFMGPNWEDAGVVLMLVPLIVPFRVISLLMGPLTDGLGRPDIGSRNLLTFTVLIPLAILIGTIRGLTGVCIALIIASILALAINFRRSLGLLELHPKSLFSAVAPTAVAAGAMYASVWLVRAFAFSDATAVWRLCASVASGVIVYAAMTFIINRSAVDQCLTLMKARA
jgi:O-antigen/teichoic acid export membrane protein